MHAINDSKYRSVRADEAICKLMHRNPLACNWVYHTHICTTIRRSLCAIILYDIYVCSYVCMGVVLLCI